MPYCLSTKHFWQLKLCQPAAYDVVIVGNSRAFLGLSPLHMNRTCLGRKIFNFGFVACSFDRAYLTHAMQLLDPKASKPALVLGLCPHCLTSPSRLNGYNYWSGQGRLDRQALVQEILRDNNSGKAWLKLGARNALNLYRGHPLNYYHPDGWEASLPVRRNPYKYQRAAELLTLHKRIEIPMVEALLNLVAEFHGQGIAVYAYRAPSHDQVRALEYRDSAIAYPELVRRFENAGGACLDLDAQAYPTYDGIHLDYQTAIRFSRDLGARLMEKLTNRS